MFARNLSRLGILAAAMLASTAALAQVSDDVVKIGVLTDMNGPAATPTGQGSVTSAQMAIDDFGGKVLGKPISITECRSRSRHAGESSHQGTPDGTATRDAAVQSANAGAGGALVWRKSTEGQPSRTESGEPIYH